jgi:colanic acid/amylovoran biosynthesis glycosyltransferase
MRAAASTITRSQTRLCVVTPYAPSLTETFIKQHVDKLPGTVAHIHGWRPAVGAKTLLSFPVRATYKLHRMVTGAGLAKETAAAYLAGFRKYNIDAVLAEYGETGVQVMEATQLANLPLIVHFHGYDASVTSVLEEHKDTYPKMFKAASAIIAVSRAMQRKLIELGAPADKIHYNPYGVDCDSFGGASPETAGPTFIAVGRFTEKKAPGNTLRAFAIVLKTVPDTRLRMLGDGPLLEECKQQAKELQIDHAVTFLGPQGHETVQREMKQSRCFVQHSLVAPNGDCEGTPVSIIEAGATGLPVVSTRHAGIPDVVVEGETGFLVDEGDVDGMADLMIKIAGDAELAGRLGKAARTRVEAEFSSDKRLGNLWRIIEQCV